MNFYLKKEIFEHMFEFELIDRG